MSEQKSTALAVMDNNLSIMPVMDVRMALQRRSMMADYVSQLMVKGTDYGVIPGTGDKPTLLKPGAEKLTTLFGLAPTFVLVDVTEDWTGAQHGGEAFFNYRYRCELYRNGVLIANSEGSCNSWEKKYRWRNAERTCPSCNKPTIRMSKPPKPGWYCWSKIGGCGAQFGADDKRISGQDLHQIPNPDIADQVNTIQKMAQKRALVGAVLLGVNASEFFTQDMEDLIDGDYTFVDEPEPKPTGKGKPAAVHVVEPPPVDEEFGMGQPPQRKIGAVTETQLNELNALGSATYNGGWNDQRHKLVSAATRGASESSKDLTQAQAKLLIDGLHKRLAQRITETAEMIRVDLNALLLKHNVASLDEANPVTLTHIWKDVDATTLPEPVAA